MFLLTLNFCFLSVEWDNILPLLNELDISRCAFTRFTMHSKSLSTLRYNCVDTIKLVLKIIPLEKLYLTFNSMQASEAYFQLPNVKDLTVTTTEDFYQLAGQTNGYVWLTRPVVYSR